MRCAVKWRKVNGWVWTGIVVSVVWFAVMIGRSVPEGPAAFDWPWMFYIWLRMRATWCLLPLVLLWGMWRLLRLRQGR